MRHECPDCETVFLHVDVCPGCGWSATKAAKLAPKMPENQRPWTPPAYREPTPAEDAEIRALRAQLHAAAWWRDTPSASRLPAVDPAIRAELARRDAQPEPVGAVVGRVLARRRA